MDLFLESEKKVLDFMEQVQLAKEEREQEQAFQNSTSYKLHCLNNEREEAKGVCLDKVFSQLYKNAVPLSDDYKVAHGDDLDAEIHDFMSTRCPKGMEYYIHEGIKKGSKPAARIMEAVNNAVDDTYNRKAIKIEGIDVKDLAFKNDTDMQKKIDMMGTDLELNDVSQIIHDNVKSTVLSEIERAKQEKEQLRQLEAELAQDMSVASESAIEQRLWMNDLMNRDFVPRLFQGIMIGNTDKFVHMESTGQFVPEYTYEALQDYGYTYEYAEDGKPPLSTVSEMAFIESVKELTKLNLVQALKLESFNLSDLNMMAYEYAKIK